MTDEEKLLFDRAFNEIESLKAQVAQLLAMGGAPTEGICLKQASGLSGGYSDEAIRQWLIKGATFGRKVGGKWHVDPVKFREWLAARKAGA